MLTWHQLVEAIKAAFGGTITPDLEKALSGVSSQIHAKYDDAKYGITDMQVLSYLDFVEKNKTGAVPEPVAKILKNTIAELRQSKSQVTIAPTISEPKVELNVASKLFKQLNQRKPSVYPSPFSQRLSIKINRLYAGIDLDQKKRNIKELESLLKTVQTSLMSMTRKSIILNRKYAIDGAIGFGANATIFRALKLTEPFCVKVQSKSLFEQEWKMAKLVGKCSTIVDYVDYFDLSDDRVAIVMEAFPMSVETLINTWLAESEDGDEEPRVLEKGEHLRVPEPVCIKIFFSLLHSLTWLNDKQLCHSDIKPQNLMEVL